MNRKLEPSLVALGKRIEAERNARGFSQVALAEKAGCSPKMIRKLANGEKTRGKILAEVCAVLEIRIDDSRPTEISDLDHGSYTLNNFGQYVGLYFAYRRSLVQTRNILRSLFEIQWDKKARMLRFHEYQKYISSETGETVDRSQSGEIFVGSRSNLLHLLTRDRGAVRLITVSQFRMQNSEDLTMSGIVLTQSPRQFQHQPSSAAIMFEKVKGLRETLAKQVGEIRNGESQYAKLAADLTRIERHIVNFALTPPPQNALKPE
jgi:transcriptional regulator with XRE-family HTH domain